MSSSRQPQPRRTSGRTLLACEPCRKRKSKCDGEKPLCGNCRSHELACHYEPVRPTRRQKYWDRDYVQALEDQVRLLSAFLQQLNGLGCSQSLSKDSLLSPSEAAKLLPYGPRLLKAMGDFGSMKWADIIGRDGMPILGGPGRFSIFSSTLLPTFEDDARLSPPLKPIPSTETFLLEIASDLGLKQHLKAHFLDNVNPFYKFVDPVWLNFSDLFPHNDTALQLLYSALFAAAAYSSSTVSREIAEAFMAYAESLVQQCYLEHLCLPVLQALLIIAWYKHMLLDSAKGNLYHYMAIGLSNHLKIRDTPQHERTVNDIYTIRTFWSLYLLDKVAAPKLGCPTGIPWDADCITPYIDTVPAELVDIPALSFDHHCRLYHIEQRYIDIMYTASFDSSSSLEKQAVFARANNAMLAFRKQIDRRLYVSRNVKPHRTQVAFWISYHSTLINLQRPLLNPSDPSMAHIIPTAFRSATASAMAITRLVKGLQASDEFKHSPPFIVLHIFRATLVHGLNSIAVEEMGGQRTSSGSFWACFRALGELGGVWKELCERAMPFVLMATRDWGFQGEVMVVTEGADAEEDEEDYEIGMDMIDEPFGDVSGVV
ncbi:hypothetical protein V8C37DRAFT_187071 [Trichoderma ceciliae]